MRGVAAAGMVLQVAVHHWQRPAFGLSRLEEMTCRAQDQSRQGRIVIQATDAFDVLLRSSAERKVPKTS
jgi:hypothetical protein